MSVFDLVKSVACCPVTRACSRLTLLLRSNKSFTFPFQNRKNVAAIALSPDGNILISVDEGVVDTSSDHVLHTHELQTGGPSSSASAGA